MIVPNSRLDRLVKMDDDGGTHALPLIEDWASWWSVWGPRIKVEEGAQPWIIFILDAHEKITELNAITMRIMMGKTDTVGNSVWSEKEWLNCETVALEAKSWFDRNVPNLKNVPDFAAFILTAQHANLAILTRLARDLRGMQEQHGVSSHMIEHNEGDGTFRVTA